MFALGEAAATAGATGMQPAPELAQEPQPQLRVLDGTTREELRGAIAALQRYKQQRAAEGGGVQTCTVARLATELRLLLPADFNEAFQRRLPYYPLLPPALDAYGRVAAPQPPPHTRFLRRSEARASTAGRALSAAASDGAFESAFASPRADDNLYAALTRHPIVLAPNGVLPPVLTFKIERPSLSAYTFTFDPVIQLHAPYVVHVARSAEEQEAALAAAVRQAGRDICNARSAGGAACSATELTATTIAERCQTLHELETECGVEAARGSGLVDEAHDAIMNAARPWGGQYVLRAVVVHKMNHYTTFAREGDSDAKWTEFDDDYVTTGKALAEAQRVWFGGQHAETQARMLFYERVSASADLPRPYTLSADDPAAHFNEARETILRRFADQSAK